MAPDPRALKLQTLLEEIQGSDAVYFQPGRNVTMEYPCIVYNVDELLTKWANNGAYAQDVGYQVVVIDRNPDNETWRAVGRLPKSELLRTEVVENLNHYYFNLYF